MFFVPSWTSLIGGIALSAAAFGVGGFVKGTSYEKGKAEVALAKAVDKAREREQAWQSDAATIEEVHATELREVNAAHLRALDGLRNRAPVRMPAASQPACAGASPASLSAPDSAVAIGWGAEFDALRADYQACKAWIGEVRPVSKTSR